MPDQLKTALRGLIKANLIHHLAHTGGPRTILRIGRAYPFRLEVDLPAPQARALRRLCLVPTKELRADDPDFKVLGDSVWAEVGRGLNQLRLWSAGSFEKAKESFERVIAARPDWAWGYLLRGEAERSLLHYREALADYDRALARDPRLAWAYAFKSRVLFQKETRARDMRLMDKAIALEPGAGWMHAWRAEGWRRLGRFKEAEKDFQKAFKLDPLYDQAYGWRAKLLIAQGRHDEAIACLKKGIALCPDFEKAYRQLVRAQRGAGKTAEALKTLDLAAALNHRNNWLGNWKVEGHPDDETAAQALAELPKDSPWRGETLCQIGRLEEALVELDRANGPWAYAWRGECLLRLGRREAALKELDRAVELDPSYGRAFVWRGRAKALARDWEGAVADFDAAMAARRVEYSWINGWRGLAKLELGRTAEALKDLDEALLLDPHCAEFQEPWLYLHRHRVKREAGLPGAARDLDTAFRRDPECWKKVLKGDDAGCPQPRSSQGAARSNTEDAGWAGVYAYRGQDRLKRGFAAEGLADLRRAAELGPEGWILAWLGEAERKTDPRKAVELFNEALRLDPKYWNAYSWRGTARLQLGDAAGALEDLDIAVKKRPTSRAWRDRSRAHLALGRRREAIADFNEAVRLNGELDWDPALGDREAAAKLHPKEAWFMVWRGDASLLRRALKNDPRYLRTYELLARSAPPKEAAGLLSRAIRYNPYSARLHFQRAEAWAELGLRAKALADLDRAESLCPRYEDARRLRDSLSAPLKSLEFFVNYSCNAKCPFCFNPPDASPELDRGLPFEELSRKMYAGFQRGYRGIKFIGGEVTLRDDLPKVLALARRIGYQSIQITTNGIRVGDPAYARKLAALGADRFRFSIHGHTPELHDRLVAVPGALKRIEKAVATLRPLGVRLGINYVLNRLNYRGFPETLRYFHETLGIDDVIVYFLRFQGFGALPQNKELLKLRMSEAAPYVREAFKGLRGKPPALIHFPPCVLPELSAHMLDWTRATDSDLVTSPDGKTAPIHEVTNSGKRQVGACASCAHAERCLGVEENYVELFGDAEFQPVRELAFSR